jgi:Holliday junction resolvase-like predicted endonuclease
MHSKNKSGSIAEEHVMIWCMNKGYYPFRAIMPVGPIDIVAINECGDTLLLDVKCHNRRLLNGKLHTISRSRSPIQKALGVNIIYVDLQSGDIHLVDHQS